MGVTQSHTTKSANPAPPPSPSPNEPPPGCPMHTSTSTDSPLNPLNNIPSLAQHPTTSNQTISLPIERTFSSIPRSSSTTTSACPVATKNTEVKADGDGERATWVYPSPQQFYNALVRKGWETPAESVPMMVSIHNWMNEAAWGEVLRWERTYFNTHAPSPPPPPVLHLSMRTPHPRSPLMRFTGRPQELSPKARYHMFLGRFFPETYGGDRPFDRHDWYVRRDAQASTNTAHRYVIDYYSAPDDEDGNPVFHLDVRPAIDDFSALRARLMEWTNVKRETWWGGPAAAGGRVEAVGQSA